ncbi:MAG: ATP-binding cassette domain-containing protein, partial [Bacteroidetes bacterium]|nr:ATP-binding cassette domain-containing protein [Bacteroidota bacterium]
MTEIWLHKRLNAPSGKMDLEVNMAIEKGNLVALYGKSGAGKTSILRMIAGLMRPTQGKITVDNQSWCDTQHNIYLRPQQRSIGFLFQDYALFPNMTVRGNLEFALQKGQDSSIIEELIEVVELGDLQKRKPTTLSGGQQQRVALARALVQKPKLLLLDEPLSALDKEMRVKLQGYLLKVHREYGLTTILVSHDTEEVSRLADQVFWLEEGKIRQTGTPE